MDKKKIGLVLSYKETNYGAQLQAYATQVVVDSMGFSTEIIDYYTKRGDRNIVLSYGLLRFLLHRANYLIKAKKHAESNDPVFLENKRARQKVYKVFIDRRFHDIVKVRGYTQLAQNGKKYDAVLIGSDQKWLPGFSFSNVPSLRFVPDNVRKISYATSLGVSEYPKYCWPSARKVWRRVDYLSVREQQGADIIKQVCGNDLPVKVVVDPTYLLTKQQWEELIPVEQKSINKYVFCYFLGNDDKSKMIARTFADEKKLKLVSVLSKESFSPIDQTFADELVMGNTPEDFINWIRGAEYVFTDSFHGTAFSVINERQFFIFYRKRKESTSRNSRIDNILAKWNLSNRLVGSDADAASLVTAENIDYERVTKVVERERADSLAFLTKSLTFDENK